MWFYLFALLTFSLFLNGCSQSSEKIGKVGLSDSVPTNSEFLKRLAIVENELKSTHKTDLVDSVKFYLYQIFYDDTVDLNDGSKSQFVSYFSIKPVRYSMEEEDLRISFIIAKQNLAKKALEIPLYNLYVNYKNSAQEFDKRNIQVLGKVYPSARINSVDGLRSFVELRKSKIDKWLLNELKKRGI